MSDTKWTEDQLKAITTRGCNLPVAAIAGSGKTAALVERIIRIITNENNPVDINRLLVITFTSAVAAETRERVTVAASRSLEANPNSEVLQRQLALLNRASITTMHSFCLDVIKNYYHVMDLDPTFRIANETENTLLRLGAINDMFEDYYESENIGLRNLIEVYSGSRDNQRLKDIVLDLYRFSMSGPWPDRWLASNAGRFNIEIIDDLNKIVWIDILKETIKIKVTGYIKMLEKAINIMRGIESLEPYEVTFLDDLDMFIRVEEPLSLGIEKLCSSVNNVSFSRLESAKKDKASDEESLEIAKSTKDSIKKETSKLIEDSFSMAVNDALNGIKNLYPYMKMISQLTLESIDRFKEKKRERNILDFNDLEHLCSKTLIENDEEDNICPPSVANSFREYSDGVLADEYQDSNNVQEAIIDLVSRKTLEDPNVFMAGDAKQSIYRFRQAKLESSLDKYNRYPLEDGDLNRKIQLYKNSRSREEAISGANYIFKEVMSKAIGKLEYNDDEALNLGANYKENNDENTMIAGPMEFHIPDKSGEHITEVEEYDDEGLVEEEEDIDSIGLEARIVTRRIKESLNPDSKTGKVFKVLDKEIGEYRPLKHKGMVILLRATKNWFEMSLEEVGSEGIPVYADTGTGYPETIEIRTIMPLLEVIDNPMQDVPMISVLRSSLVSFSAEELGDIRLSNKEKYFYEIIKGVPDDVYEANEELKNKCKIFINNLGKRRNKSIYTPIDEFIWYLHMDTTYYGYVGVMLNGKPRQANLKILSQRAK